MNETRILKGLTIAWAVAAVLPLITLAILAVQVNMVMQGLDDDIDRTLQTIDKIEKELQ